MKTECYEIASYTALVQMARDLDESDAVKLPKANLDQEEIVAKRDETIAKELGRETKAKMKEQDTAAPATE